MHHPTARTRGLAAGILAGAIVLAACGSDDAGSPVDDTTEPTTTEPTATEPTATEPTTTEPTAPEPTEPADTAMRAFTDGLGEVVEIPADPQSVVACGYAVLPLIQAGANLSAVCEWSRELDNMDAATLAAYEVIPKVAPDGSASSISYEAVAAADPDLIILGVPAPALGDVNLDALNELAPVVILAPNEPGEWRELGEQYADAGGVSDAYGEARASYEALAAEIATEFSELFASASFGGVCTPCGIYDGTFVREYTSSYVTKHFDDLGAEFPVAPDVEYSHSIEVSLENITESLGDVDVIVYGVEVDGSVPAGMEELFESTLWQALPAVQSGRLIEVRHHSAATHPTAMLALESIREQLAALPPL